MSHVLRPSSTMLFADGNSARVRPQNGYFIWIDRHPNDYNGYYDVAGFPHHGQSNYVTYAGNVKTTNSFTLEMVRGRP